MALLSVPDMSCGHCRATVQQVLASLPEIGAVTIDGEARTVATAGPAPAETVVAALGVFGFPATVLG